MSRRHKRRNDHGAAPKPKEQAPPALPPNSARWRSVARYVTVFACGAALAAAGLLLPDRFKGNSPTKPAYAGVVNAKLDYERPWRSGALPSSHYDLLKMTPNELAQTDFALMNLLCAKDLPGAEGMDIPAMLKKRDDWAAKVHFETERHLYRVNDPQHAEHYKHSEARLRAEFIVQVLQEDCGVHYNLEQVRNVDFGKSQDSFIHGMVGSDNGGTCASLPVLYTAIGRRLGYPIKLALAREHIFMRWEDGKERFNIDGAGNGGVDYPDDAYYRSWLFPITDKMMASGEFLKSLTPQEELATFLLTRGVVLHAHQRYPEAAEAYSAAHRLMPAALSPHFALLTAMNDVPMPIREKDQMIVAGAEALHMARQAFMQYRQRAMSSDDPTRFLPMYGGRPEPVIPMPPRPGQPRRP
ncbi:MAG: hypothetical protein HRU75_05045 [Planctomycetia bacterium]|nr:MAG: hypothetical protein HRU75_05045 [Planctomycetia bacterium]